jgi:hypothetical protein
MNDYVINTFAQNKCSSYDSYKQKFLKLIEQLLNSSFIISEQISQDNFNNVKLLELNTIQKYLDIINNKYCFNANDEPNIIDFYIEHLYFLKWCSIQDYEWNSKYRRKFINNKIIGETDYFYHKNYQQNLGLLLRHENKNQIINLLQ